MKSRDTYPQARLAWVVVTCALTFGSSPVVATEIERHGEAYIIRLPAELEYQDVVDRLKTEIQAQNWEIVHVQDVDTGLKEHHGKEIENKVISVCQSQYLSQAIEDDPYISLIIPCRFTAFRDPGSRRIVVGFADPAAEAKAMNIERAGAADIAANELKAVLESMLEIYTD